MRMSDGKYGRRSVKLTLNCKRCGVVFESHNGILYCSEACRQSELEKRNAERREKRSARRAEYRLGLTHDFMSMSDDLLIERALAMIVRCKCGREYIPFPGTDGICPGCRWPGKFDKRIIRRY